MVHLMISSESDSSSEETPTEEPEFANRAERRAHGKSKGAQQHTEARGDQQFARRGNVQQPRSYGNRRSG
jgi:hypothetical protein